MLIAMVWLVPFMGALLATSYLPPQTGAGIPAEEPLLPGTVIDPAPTELAIHGVPPFPLLTSMQAFNGIPFMNWRELSDWIASIDDVALKHTAAAAGTRAWLLHMRDALGPHFRLYESDQAYVLSSLENRVVVAMAEYIATTRKRIGRVLETVAKFPAGEKSIVLVLDDEDSYYAYAANYYPDGGEFAFSGGMFINFGCAHFVVKRGDLLSIEPVIAHEMTHSAVAHLNLPTWLDEGLAVNTEHRVAGVRYARQSAQELRRRHRAFWNDASIQEFWSGSSFHRTDDGNLLSYDLARIMVEQMASDWPLFTNFVLNARRDDAGALSANENLAVDLGAYVCTLLEREPSDQWTPSPATWGPSAAVASQAQFNLRG